MRESHLTAYSILDMRGLLHAWGEECIAHIPIPSTHLQPFILHHVLSTLLVSPPSTRLFASDVLEVTFPQALVTMLPRCTSFHPTLKETHAILDLDWFDGHTPLPCSMSGLRSVIASLVPCIHEMWDETRRTLTSSTSAPPQSTTSHTNIIPSIEMSALTSSFGPNPTMISWILNVLKLSQGRSLR